MWALILGPAFVCVVICNSPIWGCYITQFWEKGGRWTPAKKSQPCWSWNFLLHWTVPQAETQIFAKALWNPGGWKQKLGLSHQVGDFMGQFGHGVSFSLFAYLFSTNSVESHFHHLPAWLMSRDGQTIKLVKKHCIRTFGYGLHQLPVTCRPVLVNGRRFRLPRCLRASFTPPAKSRVTFFVAPCCSRRWTVFDIAMRS